MTEPSSLSSLALPGLPLSIPISCIAYRELSDSAPAVIGKSRDTEVSLRTFSKPSYLSSERFVTVGLIVNAEHMLGDVNEWNMVSLRAFLEETFLRLLP